MNKASGTPTERDEGLRLLINRGAEIAGGGRRPCRGNGDRVLAGRSSGCCCWGKYWHSRDNGR